MGGDLGLERTPPNMLPSLAHGQSQALPLRGLVVGALYIHIPILHLSYGDGLDVPDQLSLRDEPVLPGQVAHTEGGNVSQIDAVKFECVRGPPAGNKNVAHDHWSRSSFIECLPHSRERLDVNSTFLEEFSLVLEQDDHKKEALPCQLEMGGA